MWQIKPISLLLALSLASLAGAARADNYVVDTVSSADAGACTSAPDDCSLTAAIGLANASASDDVITFDATVFASRQTIALSSRLVASGGLSMSGPVAGVVLRGNGQTGVLRVINGGRVTLSNLTISGGNALSDNAIEGSGGAIANYGTLALSNCAVSGNKAAFFGGGIYNKNALSLSGVTLTGNTAGNGGGVFNDGTLAIVGCTLGNNAAAFGGGLFNINGVRVAHSTFAGNTATRRGGALYDGGTLTLANVTVAGNAATQGAGAIENAGNFSATNSLFAANGADAFGGFAAPGARGDAGFNFSFATLADAGLDEGPKENGGPTPTLALLPGSAAIDAGDPNYDGAAFDQRGEPFARVRGGRVDVGAFESAATSLGVAAFLTPRDPFTNDTLRATVSATNPNDGTFDYLYLWQKNGAVLTGETGPTLNLQKPGNGDKGDVITLQVTASDGRGGSGQTIVSATVQNSAPVAISSQGEVPANTEKGFVLNAYDADGDAVTFKRVGGPRNGVTADIRVDPTDGQTKLFYKSRPFYGGVDVIRFVVFDSSNKQSNESTLGIRVFYTPPPPANRAPIAGDTNLDTFVGTSEVKGLLGSDPDGDAITFRVVGNAKYGKSIIKRDTDGFFKLFYTSLNRFYGPDVVTYIVTDSRGKESNLARVNVNFINRSPVAVGNFVQVASGELVSQFLFADDPDNDAVTYRLVNNPRFGRGEVKLDPEGKWRFFYTSLPGYVGTDQITFIAIDPFGKESSVAAIDINVVRVTSTPPSALQSQGAAPSGGGS